MGPEVLLMSHKAWDSLSPEDQAIFREAARESTKSMRTYWQDWERRSQAQAEASGNQVVASIDKQPFEAAMNAIYGEALREPKLRDLVDRIRRAQ
jgi:TRAP-type C4-dicarboxylate transport system substrate-binding protein